MSVGVTVVIPTLDRDEYLISTVRELLEQDYRPMEILVVDQSVQASEKMLELARAWPETIFYHHVTAFRGLPAARNFGWQRARHDLILFLDDDVHSRPRLVEEHVKGHAASDTGIVAGGVIEARGEPPGATTGRFGYWTATPECGFNREGTFEVDIARGCNFSVKREVFAKVGGVDETLTAGAALYEETDFCLRAKKAGYRVIFHGAARIVHFAAPSGGCRVFDVRKYVWSLSRNRSLLIGRHLKLRHRPTAFARLALLGLSYTLSSRDPRVAWSCLKGVREGLGLLARGPEFTRYPEGRA